MDFVEWARQSAVNESSSSMIHLFLFLIFEKDIAAVKTRLIFHENNRVDVF